MKLQFNIKHRCQWGESIILLGNETSLGEWNPSHAITMQCLSEDHWQAHIQLENHKFEYKYAIRKGDGSIHWEQGDNRKLCINEDVTTIHDKFRLEDSSIESIFNSKVFSEAIMRPSHQKSDVAYGIGKCRIQFHVRTARCGKNASVGIIGSGLGTEPWTTVIGMSNINHPRWELTLHCENKSTIEYKYVIYNIDDNTILSWEDGDNHVLYIDEGCSAVIVDDNNFRHSTPWRGCGVVVPVFSLRSESDFGCGTFHDLSKLAYWCHIVGMKMIQVLPINDTMTTNSWHDSYPYKAISVHALHPMYLNIDEMGVVPHDISSYYEIIKKELNSSSEIDYPNMIKAKWEILKSIYAYHGKDTMVQADYIEFCHNNKAWLLPYSAFCLLRDRHGSADFRTWGGYSHFSHDLIDKLLNDSPTEAGFYMYLQYHLDRQLHKSIQYMHSLGIAFKGDIPIGISPNSVEAWTLPELFNLDAQAGAPPDDFAIIGQNWGFPTYNWERMSEDNYQWWRDRLTSMSRYFDAYRIDHILGFFRIWEIPCDAIHGLLGHFSPALPLTPQEISQRGIPFDEQRYCRPYITTKTLETLLGNRVDEVAQHFFEKDTDEMLSFKKDFDSQRKIQRHFENKVNNDPDGNAIKDALLSLHDEVLFVRDPDGKRFHPRITPWKTNSFRDLDTSVKTAFRNLHDEFFFQRHNNLWRENAMRRLPIITQTTTMLSCGEDLGMIPDSVPSVMKELKILSLEVQRMSKDPHTTLGVPKTYPYLSVATTSTHDMPTLRGWCSKNKNISKTFYQDVLQIAGVAYDYDEAQLMKHIIEQHLSAASLWTILPIQDLLSFDETLRSDNIFDEQINDPANENNHWRYRLHLDTDTLIHADQYNKTLKEMIDKSGRNEKY